MQILAYFLFPIEGQTRLRLFTILIVLFMNIKHYIDWSKKEKQSFGSDKSLWKTKALIEICLLYFVVYLKNDFICPWD